MAIENPTVTVGGRISFPKFTAQEAFDSSQGGKYPAKSVEEAKPSFDLLLTQAQLDKVVKAIEDQFIPFVAERNKQGEKKNQLEPADVKDILKGLKSGEWKSKLYQLPIKEVHEKTAEMAPEAVATISVRGQAGSTLEQRAIVRDEKEVSDPDFVFTDTTILPIGKTVHEIYPGCNVKVTINFYAYYTQGTPGITAGASVVVFDRDNDRFGGGVAVDEEAMFLDD